eukprot:766697-Hanusia_phi.AAC.3
MGKLQGRVTWDWGDRIRIWTPGVVGWYDESMGGVGEPPLFLPHKGAGNERRCDGEQRTSGAGDGEVRSKRACPQGLDHDVCEGKLHHRSSCWEPNRISWQAREV